MVLGEKLRLSLSQLKSLRRQFGPGYAGEWAFRTVAKGGECVAQNQDGGRCGQPAIGTVDADILGWLDLFPFCAEEHAKEIESGIEHDLGANGSFPSAMSRNGWGRVQATEKSPPLSG